ncbi:MAG: hypothetical protein MMC33_001425 [Icmadophila ericetorum]|nr:hypothetical protein [Icmadophila ericetorum]
MSDSQRTTRRTSARLADKDDHSSSNGGGSVQEKGKGNTLLTGNSSTQVKINGGGARAKRKKEMEEEDDGFQFTRTRKKAKAEPVVQPPAPIIEEAPVKALKPAPARKSRKKSIGLESPVAVAEKEATQVTRRRSPRISGESVTGAMPPLEVKKKRSKENGVKKGRPRKSEEAQPIDVQESVDIVGIKPPLEAVEISRAVTIISLPFADTPIIRRNQEMRRGASDSQRRSSLGLRGRRASSLINSGKSNALPHDGVDSAEFYKHVESNGLPEPHRMKQILIWCGTRALQEKPSFAAEDSNAKLAAREIQQQLLKDIVAKSGLSNWFDREITAPPPKAPEPNPKNISNLSQIQKVEENIARLQAERQQWEALLKPPKDTNAQPSYIAESSSALLHDISPDLLSESQATILQSLQSLHLPKAPSLAQTTRQRIEQITSNIEFDVDSFAENTHILEQFQQAAEKIADDILALSAQALEERDKRGRAEGNGLGTREILRGLSRAIER